MSITKWSALFLALTLLACNNNDDNPTTTNDPNLIFQFQFDPQQERLDGFGNPIALPDDHAAQSPDFNSMSVHYIEFVPNQFTFVGDGAVVYEGQTQDADTGSGFDKAIVWKEAIQSGAGEVFHQISLGDLPPGTYEYLRASVTFQNFDVRFNLINQPSPLPAELNNQSGTLASFIGFNTFIDDLSVKNHTIAVDADKPQGFWAFEPLLDQPYQDLYLEYANPTGVETGQAPPGSTTVVNLLEEFGVTLPQGSCIVTGKLTEPLTITGDEADDLTVTLSFSVNQSFEWIDTNNNDEWDFDVGNQTVEQVVDMGLRGLVVEVD